MFCSSEIISFAFPIENPLFGTDLASEPSEVTKANKNSKNKLKIQKKFVFLGPPSPRTDQKGGQGVLMKTVCFARP